MPTYTEQEESEIVELFMLNEDDRAERLKAHYRQGKIVDGKWVNDEEEEEPSFWKPKKYRYSEEEEEVGSCGSCDIELDHLRDGTTEDGHRCSDCYWTETQGYIPA